MKDKKLAITMMNQAFNEGYFVCAIGILKKQIQIINIKEHLYQFIMSDNNIKKIDQIIIDLAQLLNNFYLSRTNQYLFITIKLFSQWSLLMVISNQFFESFEQKTEFGQYINQISAFIFLEAGEGKQNNSYVPFIKVFLAFLYFLTMISTMVLLNFKKSNNNLISSFEIIFHYVFTTFYFFSLPTFVISISQLIHRDTDFSTSLDIINIIGSILSIYTVQVLAINVETSCSEKSVLRIYKHCNGASKIVKIAICCLFIIFQLKSKGYRFLVYFSLLMLHGIQLKDILKCRKYLNDNLQKTTEIIMSVWLASLIVMIFTTLLPFGIIFENVVGIFLTVTLLLHHSLKVCIEHSRQQALVLGQSMIVDQDGALSYIMEIINSLQTQRIDQNNITKIFKSLEIQNHQKNCNKIDCICQNKNLVENRQKLLKMMTQDILKEVSNKFPTSICLKLIYFGFKLSHSQKIIHLSYEISRFLKKKQLKSFNFQEKYIIMKIEQKIKDKFSEYNLIDNDVKCQNVFVEEIIKMKIEQTVNQILDEIIEKNKLLQQESYSLNLVEESSIKINRLICQMEKIESQIAQMNSFNYDLYKWFIFYHQNVIPSQVDSKKIMQEILQKLNKLNELKGFSKSVINKYIYSKKSCIIESGLQEQFGVITNVSRYCEEVLGKKRESLLNVNVNSIMPEYFAKSHQQSMNNWLQNCEVSQYKLKIAEFGYVDTNQISFQGYFFIKIIPGAEGLRFYSVVIRQNDKDYVLLNCKLEIEGIGRQLIVEDIFGSQHLKQSIKNYTQFDFDKKLSQINQIKGKMTLQNLSNICQTKRKFTHKPMGSGQIIDKNRYKYECNVKVSKFFIHKDYYFLIKFENVKRLAQDSQSSLQKSIRFGSGKYVQDNLHSNADKMIDDVNFQQQANDESADPANNVKFTQLLINSQRNASVSSVCVNEATYYKHFIKEVKTILLKPTLFPNTLFKKMTFFFIVFSSLIAAECFCLRKLFQVGFTSFNNVMFGDGTVNDNNQIMWIMYNNVLMSRIHCDPALYPNFSSRCIYLLNSTQSATSIMYESYVSNVQTFLQNRTSLSGMKYLAYYDQMVPFTIQSTTESISSIQFMEYYYAAIQKVYTEISQGRGNSNQADEGMNVLLNNWETVKFMNHDAIKFYLSAGEYELNILLYYLLALGSGLLICTIALGLGHKKYNEFILRKKKTIISLHSQIGNKLLKNLLDYYVSIKKAASDLKVIPQKFSQTLNHDHFEGRKKTSYRQSNICSIKIFFLVLMIVTLTGVQILQISLVLPSCMNMVHDINSLMDSESLILEDYLQLKTYYLNFNFNKTVDQISLQISSTLNQTQPLFSLYVKNSLDIFSDDPNFKDDFNALLIQDACKLTEMLVDPWQAYYCFNNFTFSTLSLGLVNGMTFWQRSAFEGLNELRNKQLQNINKIEYFTQDVYKDIDDSIFYMYQLWYLTQARMYKGLSYIVDSSLLLLDILNGSCTIILCIVLIWWIASYRNQQQIMADLYGVILQLPQSLMRAQMITKVKHELEVDE